MIQAAKQSAAVRDRPWSTGARCLSEGRSWRDAVGESREGFDG